MSYGDFYFILASLGLPYKVLYLCIVDQQRRRFYNNFKHFNKMAEEKTYVFGNEGNSLPLAYALNNGNGWSNGLGG